MTEPGSRFGSAWDSPGFVLWRTTLRWQRAMRDALQPHGLTHPQFVLLVSAWWLEEHDGPPSQRRLADHAGTDAMTTSQVLRTLASAGLVARGRDSVDTRIVRVTVTGEGRRRLRDALADVEAADVAFFASIDAASLLAQIRPLAGGTS